MAEPDVVVSSTTDDISAVNAAAGPNSRQNQDAAVEEKAPPTGDEQVESGAEEQEQEPPKQPEEDKSAPKNLTKRFDKLYKEKKQLEERIAAMEARQNGHVEEVKQTPVVPTEVSAKFPSYADWGQKQIADGKPAEMEDWLEERDAWKDAKRAQEEEKQAIQEQQAQVVETYNEKVESFKAEHEDWEDVVGQAIDLPAGVGPAILEMENGPDVAYYLGKNPKEAAKLNQMSPFLAVAEIGRISARLEKAQGAEETQQVNGKGPDKAPIVSSKAPSPISPLKGGALRATRDLNDPNLSFDEYRKIRDEQEKQRYRR